MLLETVKAQADSLREEVATIGGVITGREMEREITKLDGERLRGETSLLRAQQEVSRAEIAIIELRTQHRQNLAAETRETQAGLDQTRRRLETAASLVSDPFGGRAGMPRLRPVFSILRTGADGRQSSSPPRRRRRSNRRRHQGRAAPRAGGGV